MAEDSEYLFGTVLANVSTKLFSKKEKERDSHSSVLMKAMSKIFRQFKKNSIFPRLCWQGKLTDFPALAIRRPRRLSDVLQCLWKTIPQKSWMECLSRCMPRIYCDSKTSPIGAFKRGLPFEEDTFENRNGSLTTDFLRLFIARAEEFSVYRHDLEELYDLFPLPRVENIDTILEKAPDYGNSTRWATLYLCCQDVEQLDNDAKRRLKNFKETLTELRDSSDESARGLTGQMREGGNLSTQIDRIGGELRDLKGLF